jgi:hypothetical protein
LVAKGGVSGAEIRGEMERGVGDWRGKCRGLREKGVATVFSRSAVPEKKNEGGAVGEEGYDRRARIDREREEKKKRLRGFLGRSVGLVALLGSGRGPNGVLHVFFCSEFFFPFSALVYLLFEVQKYFGNTLLNW